MLAVCLNEDAGRTAYLVGLHAAQAFLFETTGKVFRRHSTVQGEFGRLTKDNPRVDDELGVTPLFVKNCTLRVKVGWKRSAPKWTQLAISEASVASPMIIAGQVDVFPLQWGEVRK